MPIRSIVDSLIPRLCVLCRQPAPQNLCEGCDADLPRQTSNCRRCGVSLAGAVSNRAICGQCIRRPPVFDRTICALAYEFPVSVLVQGFKFRRNLPFGEVLARALVEVVEQDLPTNHSIDAIIPVPLHPLRQFRRVFNQADVLARHLGRALNIPVAGDLLWRTRHTSPQSGQSAIRRRANLRGAFCCKRVPAHHVVLVDDVMTTGTTLSECARVLKRAGAQEISVWVAARA